jgi:beta-N-acetylhexosaminidase
MSVTAFVTGCASVSLSAEETHFFSKAKPWGLILFKRNCEAPEQIKALTAQFRAAVCRKDAPVFIDQEGGRVQRLGPPNHGWRNYPSAAEFGKLYNSCAMLAFRTVRNSGRLMAEELYDIGITSSCLPVLDIPQAGSHDVIGNRAYALVSEQVIALARLHTAGLMEGGILPVMKHIPGHGRSTVDSHHDLPIVTTNRAELERVDFAPFAAFADCPMAMTAHVIYSALDASNPATLSRKIIREVIRKTINFTGLLMTDDLSMKALGGSFAEKAQRALSAGCDVLLHCSGNLAEMEEVAAYAGALEGKALRRAKQALKARRKPLPYDKKAALKDLELILSA